MPKAFEDCAADGKVRTISGPSKKFGIKAGEYLHVCFNSKKEMFRGEVKNKEAEVKK